MKNGGNVFWRVCMLFKLWLQEKLIDLWGEETYKRRGYTVAIILAIVLLLIAIAET